jgi:hypothetical protein
MPFITLIRTNTHDIILQYDAERSSALSYARAAFMSIPACVTYGSTSAPVELAMNHDIRVPKIVIHLSVWKGFTFQFRIKNLFRLLGYLLP